MNLIKKIVNIFLYLIYFFISTLVILEIIFRLTPTSESLKLQPVNDERPILHFLPNQEVIRQTGFNFQHSVSKKINNYGYATDINFQKKNKKKIAAIIGDSYVEALQLDNKKTFHGLLNQKMKDTVVYPFGVSGSQLPQYLAFMKFAEENFNPEIYIFIIIENDFDESWKQEKGRPGFHYFDKLGKLERVDYNPGFLKKILRNSAFLRYLHLDLKGTFQLKRIFNTERTTLQNNNKNEKTVIEGFKAIDFFFKNVQKITKQKKVILLLDGDRRSIYSGYNQRNINYLPNIWFETLISKSKNHHNILVVDLHNYFLENWRINKLKFNYDYDYHWNENGHNVVAEVIKDLIESKN